jgi:flagellum-specific ATP synthase
VMTEVATSQHLECANRLKDLMATYREAADLINIGAYQKGNNPKIDFAIDRIDAVNTFLRQGIQDQAPYDQTISKMASLLAK